MNDQFSIEEHSRSGKTPMVVLIVDDSRAMRRVQRQVLSRLGELEILEAEDGFSAIQQMKSRNFQIDLILVDWVMPRMNGITFLRLIKSNPNLCKIPILMVTSCCDERMMTEAREAGVDGYLLKPFTKELFLQAILALGEDDGSDVPRPQVSELADDADGQNSFLDELPEAMRRRILDMSIVVEYAQGETVLDESQVVSHFYYLIDGQVEERQSTLGSSGDVVRSYSAGECLGVLELMSGDPLNSEFVATSDARAGRLPQAAFEDMLMKYPEIGSTLSRVLADRARQLEVQEDCGEPKLSGGLEILDLPALVQAISLRQKTCIIELPEIGGEICFVCGQVIAARYDGEDGKEAFFRIIDKQPRKFQLVVKSVRRKREIRESTMNLLLECARRTDELPSPSITPTTP